MTYFNCPKWLVLAALTLAGCDSGEPRLALGTLERDAIRLTAPASEIITDIHVREGDQVKPGTPLLQLDDRAFRAEEARAIAAVNAAQAYVTQLENGARTQELASAAAHVTQAQATADEAQKTYERTARLVEQGLQGQAVLDEAIARRDSAYAVLEDAREQLDLLREGTRSEQLEQARAQLEQARQALVFARKQAADLQILATRDGRVDSLPWELGERVPAGSVVAILLAGKPYVRAYMPESARSQLVIGQQFAVTIDGQGSEFRGTLRQVQQDPAFSPHFALTEAERTRLMYLVEVELDMSANDLPSGIPAQIVLANE